MTRRLLRGLAGLARRLFTRPRRPGPPPDADQLRFAERQWARRRRRRW